MNLEFHCSAFSFGNAFFRDGTFALRSVVIIFSQAFCLVVCSFIVFVVVVRNAPSVLSVDVVIVVGMVAAA